MDLGEDTIEIVRIEACVDSDYIKPKSLYYRHNRKEKRWDVVETHDSVAILLYHESMDAFVFVMQFLPSIYLKTKMDLPMSCVWDW